jgi:hypothetical protein
MLLLSDYGVISPYLSVIAELGFGFSTMSEPTDPYSRPGCMEMLRDWGWSGALEKQPSWL